MPRSPGDGEVEAPAVNALRRTALPSRKTKVSWSAIPNGFVGEAEPLVDEVLREVVLAREAHRAELAVHLPGEAAVGVDPATEPVARLEDRDPWPASLSSSPPSARRCRRRR